MRKFIPKSSLGILLTLLLVGIGGYLAYEHRKKEGFWWGALASVLVLAIIVISQIDTGDIAIAPAAVAPAAPEIQPTAPVSTPAPAIPAPTI